MLTRAAHLRMLIVSLGLAAALAFGVNTLLQSVKSQPNSIAAQREALGTFDCTPSEGLWLDQLLPLVNEYHRLCAEVITGGPGGEFHNVHRHNNYGMIDTNVTLEKPADVYRILILGDSMAQGWEVPMPRVYPTLLEQALNAAAGRRIEVINLSKHGFGTDRQIFMYTVLGWQFNADLVILSMYTGNDISDNQYELETLKYGVPPRRAFFTLDDAGVLRMHNTLIFDPAIYPQSPAYQWLITMQQNQGDPAPPYVPPERPRVLRENPDQYLLEYPVDVGMYLPDDAYWANGWAITERLVLELRDLVLAQGSAFAVVVLPDRPAVHPYDWQLWISNYSAAPLAQSDPTIPADRLTALVAAHGIPVLNMQPAMLASASPDPKRWFYYEIDEHFTIYGHAIVAQTLDRWLRETGLVPRG